MTNNCFCRDSSDRLTFEMFKVTAEDYPALSRAVASAFSLSLIPESFVAGWDVVAMDFRRGEQVIEMAWNNWSGFVVTAKTSVPEPLVRKVVEWLPHSKWGEYTLLGQG